MYGGRQRGGFVRILAGLAFFFLVLRLMNPGTETTEMPFWDAVKQDLAEEFADVLYVQFMPGGADFAGESNVDWLVRTQAGSLMPLYGIGQGEQQEYSLIARIDAEYQQSSEENAHGNSEQKETESNENQTKDMFLQAQAEVQSEEELLALLETENEAARVEKPFVPHSQRVQVNLEELTDYETLVKQFYTIDANTFAGTERLNVQSLMDEDVGIEKNDDAPQILIYHTHSQEAFADSVPGDASTSIVGVGERLTEILQEEYGYQVLHHTGQYDVDSRDDAYGKSLPALEQLLAENPSIEVVIDLHRDQMPEETKLVMDLDGRPTARFMFFNGLSRTRQSGDIDYLKNENIEINLAMSFQMQLKCEEYYPGLTRKIYLKGYRYNMHLCPRTLLVELGAQNNTVEEAMNACEPLAHVLDMVLSGE